MFGKDKVTQSMIDAVKQVVETAPVKEPTKTGMRVYGGSYGNSAKAKQDQTKSSVDTLKGPKDKEMKEELKGDQHKIDANHNDKIDAQDFKILKGKKKVKEGMEFAEKLLASIQEKKDVVLPEARNDVEKHEPKKNEYSIGKDVSDKSWLKDAGKKPTVKSDLKNLGRFLTGKKETNEEITTDMIKGREAGGKSNSLKPFKVTLAPEVKAPASDEPADTKAKKSIEPKKPTVDLKNVKEEEEIDATINEVLSKDASAGDWIHDFVHSDDPKFAGKSKAERKKQALAAYYAKQRNEEVELEEGRMKDLATNKAEDERLEKDGWKETPTNVKDKSGAVHTPMSRAKDLARSAFKKIQKETMMGKISN